MCLGTSTPRIRGKGPPLIPSSILFDWFPLAQLSTCVQLLLQNGAKCIQKLTPRFKNHMRDNFRQAVESSKSSNSMGYFCPKNIFLQLKHYIQRIHLTLLSTTCLKIHQIPCVIFETISQFFYFKYYKLLTKVSHQSENVQTFHCSS